MSVLSFELVLSLIADDHCSLVGQVANSYAKVVDSLHTITDGYERSVDSVRLTRSHLAGVVEQTGKLRRAPRVFIGQGRFSEAGA